MRSAWRWENVPVPEQFLVGFAAGVLLHIAWPRRLTRQPATIRAGGAMALAAGTAMAAWATRSAGTTYLDRPDQIVTTGAYARSRNPMYVGSALAYVGSSALGNTAWPLILFPAVAAAVHREVRHEERRLAHLFPFEYQAYASNVRRYLGQPCSRNARQRR